MKCWRTLKDLLNERNMHMIKKDLKCPQCGKTLLRLYGTALRRVECTCGYLVDLKTKEHGEEVRRRAKG